MKRIDGRLAGVMAAVLTVAACAPQVVAPTVPVMPGQGKQFDQFANDQATCEAYANQQIAPLTQQANNNGLGQALITTALGAGLGAAIGGGRGAAIGAASSRGRQRQHGRLELGPRRSLGSGGRVQHVLRAVHAGKGQRHPRRAAAAGLRPRRGPAAAGRLRPRARRAGAASAAAVRACSVLSAAAPSRRGRFRY